MSDCTSDLCKSRKNDRGVAYWVFLFLKGLSAIIKRADDLDAAQRTLKIPEEGFTQSSRWTQIAKRHFRLALGGAFHVGGLLSRASPFARQRSRDGWRAFFTGLPAVDEERGRTAGRSYLDWRRATKELPIPHERRRNKESRFLLKERTKRTLVKRNAKLKLSRITISHYGMSSNAMRRKWIVKMDSMTVIVN